jgi:hypothetical protein
MQTTLPISICFIKFLETKQFNEAHLEIGRVLQIVSTLKEECSFAQIAALLSSTLKIALLGTKICTSAVKYCTW